MAEIPLLGTAAEFLRPASRTAAQIANIAIPNVIPGVEAAIRVYNSGRATEEQLSLIMRANGASLNLPWWKKIVDLSSTPASLSDVIYGWRRKTPGFGEDLLIDTLGRHGYKDDDQINAIINKPWHIDKETARILYQSEAFHGEEKYTDMLRAAGLNRSDDRALFEKLVKPPSLTETMVLLLRGNINEDVARRYMCLMGITDEEIQTKVMSLRFGLPGTGEIVNLAGRQAWNLELANKFGLDAGLEATPLYRFLLNAQGIGTNLLQLPGQPTGSTDWPTLLWRTSRTLPTFVECRKMQQLLRGSGENGATGNRVNYPAWTEGDTSDILKLDNVPETIRKAMLGLVYEPISIRHVRMIIEEVFRDDALKAQFIPVGQSVQAWIKGMMADLGVDDKGAELLSFVNINHINRTIDKEKELTRKGARSKERELTLKRYGTGVIGLNETLLLCQGPECDLDTAQKLTIMEDASFALKQTEQHIAHIHDGFMHGRISYDEALQILLSIGIQPIRRVQYMSLWTAERTEDRVMFTTAQILALVKDGLVAPDVAQYRLVNLGWDNADALLSVNKVVYDLQKASVATAAKLAQKQSATIAKAKSQTLLAQTKQAIAAKKQQDRITLAAFQAVISTNKYFAEFAKQHGLWATADADGDDDAKEMARRTIIAAWAKMQQDISRIALQNPPSQTQIVAIETAAETATVGVTKP